ncbi:aspartyl protease family protein [Sphingobacterium siyangense]|uniref:aspartyl protease family protein n=1 Tax=Sphingobacterium siyangense TaxID=459529 RepID=UPI003DA28FE9
MQKFDHVEQIRTDVSVDFAGIGGQMQQVVWSAGNRLQIGGMVLNGLEAPVSEMDDMQLEDGSPIFGLLGIGVLKNYQFTLDYGRQELLLEKLDERGELLAKSIEKGPLLAQYPLRLKRHMGIDCGANANVLKKTLETELKPYIDFEEGEVDIKGVNGTSQGNRIAFLTHAKVGELALQDMYTVITDQAIGGGTGNDALPIEGLLGTPF